MKIVYDLLGNGDFEDSVGINGVSIEKEKILLGVEAEVLHSVEI